MDRRDFASKITLAAMATTLGTPIVFGNKLPKGYLPLGIQEVDPFQLF